MAKSVIADVVQEAERNARARELANENLVEQKKANLLAELNELTGEEFGVYKKRAQNSRVAFAQIIQHNVQLLVEIGYLTTSEESFLFKISAYIDFKTNVIVERDYKNQKKTNLEPYELPKAAGVTYMADLIGVHRTNASRLLKSLKNKGVLAVAETGARTADGRFCNSRTWFMNPNIMYCGDKSDIDNTVRFLFRDTLTNLKNKEGKTVKLPVNLLY